MSSAMKIKAWLLARQPPSNLMHVFTLVFQFTGIGGFGLATFSYVKRERESHERYLDDQVNFSLAQCQAFYRENNIHEMLHRIEVYKWSMQKNDWRHGVEFIYMPPFLRPRRFRDWADKWLVDRNSGLDPEASAVEIDRAKLTSFWYMVKQCWEQNPQRRDRLTDFLFEAPLNQGTAMKHLFLVEALDQARCRSHPECTWDQHKPPVYDFLRELYGLSGEEARPPEQRARPAPASTPSWGASSSWVPADLQASWRSMPRVVPLAERPPGPGAAAGAAPRGHEAPPPPLPLCAAVGGARARCPSQEVLPTTSPYGAARPRSITGHEVDWAPVEPTPRATPRADLGETPRPRRSITKVEAERGLRRTITGEELGA